MNTKSIFVFFMAMAVCLFLAGHVQAGSYKSDTSWKLTDDGGFALYLLNGNYSEPHVDQYSAVRLTGAGAGNFTPTWEAATDSFKPVFIGVTQGEINNNTSGWVTVKGQSWMYMNGRKESDNGTAINGYTVYLMGNGSVANSSSVSPWANSSCVGIIIDNSSLATTGKVKVLLK